MNHLRTVQHSSDMPEHIRNAAACLIVRVSPDFTTLFGTNPIEDARILVEYFLRTP